MILTIDLGSSATKAVVWDGGTEVCAGREPIVTDNPRPGWSEQDPRRWWPSVVGACRRIDARDRGTVTAIGFAAARESFVPVTADGECLRAGILWSDTRADDQAARICAATGGAEELRQRTGVVVGAGSTAAKVAWVSENEPEVFSRARWLLAPRDLVVMTMTGEVTTDHTLASRTGFFDIRGEPVPGVYDLAGGRLPPVRESAETVGELTRQAAKELGLGAGIPVVLGAGDRACEVLGSGSSTAEPVVSWGTTASVSAPLEESPASVPKGLSLSRGALGGHVLEAGLSASGQAMAWLARLTGRSLERLSEEAAMSEPGAMGVVALPWLNGARAPWWNPSATAAFLGISAGCGPGDLARALYEGVAADVARCLDAMSSIAEKPRAVRAVGGAAGQRAWLDALTGITGTPALRLRSDEAASAGACLIVARATGATGDAAAVNPVASAHEPDLGSLGAYRRLRSAADASAEAVLQLAEGG